jgi:hypothetical protein
LVIVFGYGFQAIDSQSGFLHQLKIAAVAVVAKALWNSGFHSSEGMKSN